MLFRSVFWLTFEGLGAWLQEQVEAAVEWLSALTDGLLTAIGIAPAIHSLIIDGIFSGVGTVIVFLPLILLLFFFLSMMEDSVKNSILKQKGIPKICRIKKSVLILHPQIRTNDIESWIIRLERWQSGRLRRS